MKAGFIAATSAAIVLLIAGAGRAQPGQRLSDKDVKQIIERIEDGRDRFEDKLDSQFKTAIIRGPRGEVNVRQYLHDFKENVDKLRDRFKPDNSASTEAGVMLAQASEINEYIKRQPEGFKGASEWDRLSVDLVGLAEAYRASFPLPLDATVRRINDAEAANIADSVARAADRLKKPIGDDKALEKRDRETVRKRLDDIARLAKSVRERAEDSHPATSEARQVMDLGMQLRADLEGRTLSADSLSGWDMLRVNLEKLEQAYGTMPPPPRS
jgi:hypothetical protein